MAVQESPKSGMWREDISAVESVGSLPDSLNAGLNFKGYDVAMFTVYPSGGAEPTVEVMAWDSVTESWVSTSPKAEFAANATDESFAFTVPAYGRGLYVRVSVLAAGSCSISASGFSQGSW